MNNRGRKEGREQARKERRKGGRTIFVIVFFTAPQSNGQQDPQLFWFFTLFTISKACRWGSGLTSVPNRGETHCAYLSTGTLLVSSIGHGAPPFPGNVSRTCILLCSGAAITKPFGDSLSAPVPTIRRGSAPTVNSRPHTRLNFEHQAEHDWFL